MGIYPVLLQFILQHEDHGSTRFWIIHAPENKASLKGIQKAGFEYVGKLYIDVHNITTIDSTKTAFNFREELEYMDIKLSMQTASSCWNCSSPYVKNRKTKCCCSTAGIKCIGNNMLSMAS